MIWEPYGSGDDLGRDITFPLNRKCTEERHLWRMICPMVCFFAVEWHLPNRVMRQFGLYQKTPPDYKDTDLELHG